MYPCTVLAVPTHNYHGWTYHNEHQDCLFRNTVARHTCYLPDTGNSKKLLHCCHHTPPRCRSSRTQLPLLQHILRNRVDLYRGQLVASSLRMGPEHDMLCVSFGLTVHNFLAWCQHARRLDSFLVVFDGPTLRRRCAVDACAPPPRRAHGRRSPQQTCAVAPRNRRRRMRRNDHPLASTAASTRAGASVVIEDGAAPLRRSRRRRNGGRSPLPKGP